jgi:hypothetical protein
MRRSFEPDFPQALRRVLFLKTPQERIMAVTARGNEALTQMDDILRT